MPESNFDALARESKVLDEYLAPAFNITDLLSKQPALDKDRDGMISDTEVKSAIPSSDFSGDDAAALASLHVQFEDICRLSRSDNEWRKATKDDLKKMTEIAEVEGMKVLTGSPLFKAVDRNGDDKLEKDELKQAADQLNTGPTKRTVDAMLANFEVIGGPKADSLTAKQIDQFAATKLSHSEEMLMLRSWGAAREFKERTNGSSDKLFAATDDGKKLIRGESITQGFVGDCWLIAGISSLAERDPQAVEKMIKENADGTYTVKFPFAHKDMPLEATVEKPSLTERGLYATTGQDGFYGSIIEKALGQIFAKDPGLKLKLTGVPAWRSAGTPVQEYLDGSESTFAVELLTGRKAMSVRTDRLNEDELHRVFCASSDTVTTCAADGRWPKQKKNDRIGATAESLPSISAREKGAAPEHEPIDRSKDKELDEHRRPDDSSPNTPSDIDDQSDKEQEERHPGMPTRPSHEFAILKYNPETRMVTVRNPIGRDEFVGADGKPLDGVDDGKMEMTLQEFSRHFHHLTTTRTAMMTGLSETPWWQKFFRGY